MAKKRTKKVREKGKLRLSKYFQEFSEGESVAVVKEISMQPKFPDRIQGRTGVVEGKQGRAYKVKINKKKFLIEPIHLKKIQTHAKAN